jgi:hypothetical protein
MNNIFNAIKSIIKYSYFCLFELPLKTINPCAPALISSSNRVIPNVVYQTWEDHRFGKTHTKGILKFRALNPDMQFHLYDRKDRDKYMANSYGTHSIYQIYKNTKFGPMKADIFRYCILFEKGGYYFDIKSAANQKISRLCPEDADGFISYENCDCALPPNEDCIGRVLFPTKYVAQWGMGFAKNHIILSRMIDSICSNYLFYKGKVFADPKLAIMSYTGPGKFTQIVREEIGLNKSINVFQAGIDFNGHGIFSMPGAKHRFLTYPSYSKITNAIIVD